MRILYISKYAVGPKYGTPARQYLMSKYLARMEGVKVMLVSSRSASINNHKKFAKHFVEEKFDDLTHIVLNGPLIKLGFNWKRLWSWLWFELQVLRIFRRMREWSPSVIIVSSLSILTFLSGVILKRLLKIPLIIEVRDVYPQTLVDIGGYSSKHPVVKILAWVEKTGYKNADLIISSLPNLEPHVEQVLGFKKSVKFIPMGYDSEIYNEENSNEEIGPALKIIDSVQAKFSVGYCGSIGLVNALEPALMALKEICAEGNTDIHLFLIGDGPLKQYYEEMYGRYANIHFLGRFEKSSLPHLLSKMDIVINPWHDQPIYRFGISPNKWIDYMKAGRPILAPYAGFPLYLEEIGFGWFVQPDNKDVLKEKLIEISQISMDILNEKGRVGNKYLQERLQYKTLSEELYKNIKEIL